jgi:hypothetical protein
MNRQLTSHKVNGCNDGITIEVLDEPGAGGANHLYSITGFNTQTNASCPFVARYGKPSDHATILFQNGPIPEKGTNGITHENLLAILEDRLKGFQSGPFACEENAVALFHIQEAQRILKLRTEKRIARGVEGTHTV